MNCSVLVEVVAAVPMLVGGGMNDTPADCNSSVRQPSSLESACRRRRRRFDELLLEDAADSFLLVAVIRIAGLVLDRTETKADSAKC